MQTAIREVMTSDPVVYPATASLAEAAQAMRDFDIGDVLIERDGLLVGIVTDRDIVVRAVAEGAAVSDTSVGDICSEVLVTVAPSDLVEEAMRVMGDFALRRVPVCDDGQPVGMVSLGDLAIERDASSVLAEISAAAPND